MTGFWTSAKPSVIAAALIVMLAGPARASAEWLDAATARIAALCMARDHADDACRCLSHEAGSRFEPGQLEHIADALAAGETLDELGDRLRRSGLSEGEAASIVYRLDSAQVVIRQTCGAAIFPTEPGE